ncbi:hypothetical protein BDD12DRAFT_807499 [Trichophaea hybrida]|nr:hypothetical protein BDD12DRAFT_807499 [Trichophaea hybrida]
MADLDEVDYRSPSSDSEFTPVIQPNHFLNHRILTFTATPIMPRIGTRMLVPNPTVKLLRVSQQAYSSLPLAHQESQIEQDEYKLIICSRYEFADKIIAMAQDLAWQNSKYSTNEILEQSLNITIAAATRLHFNKLSGWQVAMREEMELVATDLRQPIFDKGYKGRNLFDGRYSQHDTEVYQDPEKRKFCMKRAEEINKEGRSGSGQDEFITTCADGALLQEAAKATTSTYKGSSGRNLMRSTIVQMLKELISKNIYFLLKGNADARSRLVRFLQQNKLQWSAPSAFGDTQQEITNNILSEVLGLMKMTHAALRGKTLTQYWIVLFSTNQNINNLTLKLEIDAYPQYKISQYLLVLNFTTTTTPSNLTNALRGLFGSPAATMSYVYWTGRKAKSTIIEAAAFGGIGG